MRTSSSVMISRTRLVAALNAVMERHHSKNDRADEDVVGKPGHADEHDAVAHDAENENAEDGPDDRASPAGQRSTADHHHGDDFELVAGPTVRVGGRSADRADDAGERGGNRGDHEQSKLGAA